MRRRERLRAERPSGRDALPAEEDRNRGPLSATDSHETPSSGPDKLCASAFLSNLISGTIPRTAGTGARGGRDRCRAGPAADPPRGADPSGWRSGWMPAPLFPQGGGGVEEGGFSDSSSLVRPAPSLPRTRGWRRTRNSERTSNR